MAGTWSDGRSEGTARRRRRRGGGLRRELARRLGFVGRVWRRLETLSRRPVLTALPLFVYVAIGSIYFLSAIQLLTNINAFPMFWDSAYEENAAEKLSAELFKQKIQALSYLLTFALLAFRVRACIAFFRSEGTLLLLMLVLLLSAVGSDYPDRVVINLVHLTMGILAVWLYFTDERRRRDPVRSACRIVFLPIMISLGGSALLFFLHPASSLSAIVEGQRFSGLGGNPNSLGGVCIAGAWATFGMMAVTPPRSRGMAFLALAFVVVLFNAWTTGSATTLSIIAGMAALMIGFRAYGRLGSRARAGLILGGATAFFGVLMFLAVQQNVDDYALAATSAVGKDLTLTGRTDLWMIAWEAFLERPVFGWGYDNHQTVMETSLYGVPYNHYHNGYLDSLVSGGVPFGLVIVTSYVVFFRRYLTFARVVGTGFPLVVAIAAVSIQNMTEYSMFRANNSVWQMYFVSFVAVAVTTVKVPRRAVASRAASAGAEGEPRRSRTRRASW